MKSLQILTIAITTSLLLPSASHAFASDTAVPELNENYNRVSMFFTPKLMQLNAPLSRSDLMKRGCAFEARLDFHKDKTILRRISEKVKIDSNERSILLRNILIFHRIDGNTVELDFAEEEDSNGKIFGILKKEGQNKYTAVSAPAGLMDELRNWARTNATRKTFHNYCLD